MCNLYSATKPQATICQFAKAMVDTSGNLPPLATVLPDQMAPVVMTRPVDGKRELLMMRWGFPPRTPRSELITIHLRNANAAWCQPYLGPYYRCLVPVTSFCGYDNSRGKAVPTWFALDETRPLFFFAGIWRNWRGVRGSISKRAKHNHMLFSILTTAPNAEVRAIREDAMPVCLLTEADQELWMGGETEDALTLQRPTEDHVFKVVAKGSKQDTG